MIDKFKLVKLEVEFNSMLIKKRNSSRSYLEKDFFDDYIYFSNRVFKWLFDKFKEEN